MKIAVAIFALLAVVVALLLLVGSQLPRDHVATVRARYAAPIDTIWRIISDIQGAPAWRSDLVSIEMIASPDVRVHWRERSKQGVISYVLAEEVAPRHRITRITDDSLPYGGQWEYALAPDGTGTLLTITERGFVKPPLFRVLQRYVFGLTTTVTNYHLSLAKRLGETVTPEVVP